MAVVLAVLVTVAAALLLYAALHDLAARTVPDWLPLALVALALPALALRHALLGGLAACLVTFVLLFAVWALRLMGGGDLKLWVAAALLVPPAWQMQLMFTARVLLLGGVLAVLYLGLGAMVAAPAAKPAGASRLRRILRAERWRIARRAQLPYAVAIAAAAMLSLPIPMPAPNA